MAETIEITVRNQQSLEDLALEHYGAVEGVLQLLIDNRKSLTEGFSSYIYTGMKLRVRTTPVNEDMYRAIKKIGLHPATDADTKEFVPQGPDFNDDFNDDFDIDE